MAETQADESRAGMTLESFVAELHHEGVEAGREEARGLVLEAEREAEAIVAGARSEAEALLAEARREAEAAGLRGRAELELAVRDAVLQLQAALTAVLESLVTRSVEAGLSDPDQLKPLIGEVVKAYARADAAGRPEAFNLRPEAAKALEGWWTTELREVLAGGGKSPSLEAELADAGFEYRIRGATVDVTRGSVVERLMELVRPGLRSVIEEAASEAIAGAGSSAHRSTEPASAGTVPS